MTKQTIVALLVLLAESAVPQGSDAQTYWQFIASVDDVELWPEPPNTFFDVYVDSVLYADNICFRCGLGLTEYPAGTLEVAIAPNASTSVDDALVTLPFVLADGDSLAAILMGYLHPENHPPNPDGVDTSLRLRPVPLPDAGGVAADSMAIRLVHGTRHQRRFAMIDADTGDTVVTTGPYQSYTDYRVHVDASLEFEFVEVDTGSQLCYMRIEPVHGAFLHVTANHDATHGELYSASGHAQTTMPAICDTAVDEAAEDQPAAITITPNPASDRVVVELNGVELADVALFDVAGRRVAHRTAGIGFEHRRRITFDVSPLAAGVHIVSATYAGPDGSMVQQSKAFIVAR